MMAFSAATCADAGKTICWVRAAGCGGDGCHGAIVNVHQAEDLTGLVGGVFLPDAVPMNPNVSVSELQRDGDGVSDSGRKWVR